MEKEEILEKARRKKALVGEMEKAKINKSCWIANIVVVIIATVLMITLGAMGVFSGLYAIAFVCLTWASVFYFLPILFSKKALASINWCSVKSYWCGNYVYFLYFV